MEKHLVVAYETGIPRHKQYQLFSCMPFLVKVNRSFTCASLQLRSLPFCFFVRVIAIMSGVVSSVLTGGHCLGRSVPSQGTSLLNLQRQQTSMFNFTRRLGS